VSKKLVALLATASLFGAAPAATAALAAPRATSALATAAKPCSSGYKHAVIGGAHKCLRRGQYCARRYDNQYHRYGFHCHKRDRNGDYHLE
jgi:hypothetical protein